MGNFSTASIPFDLTAPHTFTGQQTFVAPVLGASTGTSLALGGATIGSNALGVTGTSNFASDITLGGNLTSATGVVSGSVISGGTKVRVGNGLNGDWSPTYLTLNRANQQTFGWSAVSGTAAPDAILVSPAAATFQYGNLDAASPVAQTLGVQSVVAGTSNTAGVNWTLAGSRGTGTGVGGSIIFQVAPAGTTGTAQNARVTALTVDSTKTVTLATAASLAFASGTNQRAGNTTLVGGTVTVSNTTVTANTVVILTRKTSGGTIGTSITYTVSAGTSFIITSDNILDTSTFSYMLIEVP